MKNFLSLLVLSTFLFLTTTSNAQMGKYLVLDGQSGYAQVSDHADLDIDASENITITCWVFSNTTSQSASFIDKRDVAGTGYQLVNQSGSGKYKANLYSTSQVNLSSTTWSSTSVLDGSWHHVAFVVDELANTNSIYIDGVIQSASTKNHALFGLLNFYNALDLYFGLKFSSNTFFAGKLDEIRYWDKAMTAGEIATDMASTLTGSETDLLAAWDFENVTGTNVPDISSNGHPATLVGGTTIFDPAHDQIITLDPISYKYTNDAPFAVNAVVSTGLPITYSIVSGPATNVGNTITLNGTAGTVVVKAEQLGDATFNPVSTTQSFDIVDLSIIDPVVSTKLTDAYPIEMPALNAYPLYASAEIDEPAALSITNIEFEVDGTPLVATQENGYFKAWWTPAAYGNYTVYVKATASNGNTDTDTVTVNVTNVVATQNVQTFDGDLIDFGSASRWFYGTYTLPQSIGAYDQIMANFAVTCPAIAGGCDDWDRLAYAEYKAPDGTWMELFRYITPYGKACSHNIDVTDYASLLHGNIEIRMFIDTWGTGGWDLHLDFDYVAGTPQYLYSNIQEVWHGDYSFGNPTNLQPCDTVSIDYPANTQKATFRVSTTGHGWGGNNTGNAAEFYHAVHNFHLNGSSVFSQDLWNDCDPNPDNCNGQAGTWQYDRAGWCPGTIAPPFIYDFTSQIGNAPFDLAYVFQQSYQDICHPNNPACITGQTCPDCNAGYNPFYRVGGYMISYSSTPIITGVKGLEEEKSFEMELYPNPSNGVFNINLNRDMGDVVVTVVDVTGATHKTYFFNKKSELDVKQFNISTLAKGTYFVNVKTEHQSVVKKIVLQ